MVVMSEGANDIGISGDWHLLDLAASEQEIPFHRMDLRLAGDRSACRGAIVNRNNGTEIPLAAVLFDGTELRVQMSAPPNRAQSAMPWLVMRRNGARFDGQWRQDGQSVGPTMKLIRPQPGAAYAPPISHP